MNRLVAFYQSSIGKKITMSLTGLFLCSFLIVHLSGNFLLLKNDGGESFDAYSTFMSTNGIIRFLEVGLALGLIGHALSGFLVWRANRAARPQKYGEYRLKDNSPLWSRITMLSGSIVFIFLVVHLRTFIGALRFTSEKPSAYTVVQEAFSSGLYSFFYVVSLVLLAYHLRHGFQAGFQTLGLRNKRYERLIDGIGVIFWLIIPLGFAIFPIYFYFFKNVANATMALGGN